MSEFWYYFNLGLHHILDWQAYDHILFIIVLVAAYNFHDWLRVIWLITLFTIGHTLSLALATYGVIMVRGELVKFLIPLTIFLTAVFNLFTAGKNPRNGKIQVLYFAAVFLGIVHGLGFSAFFNSVSANASSKILPLLELALGIEAAQIILVIVVLILSFIFQTIFRFSRRDWVMVISSIVIGFMIPMLLDNIFW